MIFLMHVVKFHQVCFESRYYYQQDSGFDRCFSDGACITLLFLSCVNCFHLAFYQVASWQEMKLHPMEECRRENKCFLSA